MKIIIISDTHGADRFIDYVIDQEKPFDHLIHLGDMEGAEDYIEAVAGCPVDMVRGNCDYYSDLPGEDLIELGEHKAFITHGHYYNVGMDEDGLIEAARKRGADIAMYGHTHIPTVTKYKEITVMNPGSLGLPRQHNRRPSYIVMEISGDQVDTEIIYL